VKTGKIITIMLLLIFGGTIMTYAQSEKESILDHPTVAISIEQACTNCAAGYNVNGTTYVPLRFVLEQMGAKVNWDQANKAVVIVTNKEEDKESANQAKHDMEQLLLDLHQRIHHEAEFYFMMDSQISVAAEMYKEFNETYWIAQLKQVSIAERKEALKKLNEAIAEIQKIPNPAVDLGKLTVYSQKLNEILANQEFAVASLDNYTKSNRTEDYKNYLLHRKFALDLIEDLKASINEGVRFN